MFVTFSAPDSYRDCPVRCQVTRLRGRQARPYCRAIGRHQELTVNEIKLVKYK